MTYLNAKSQLEFGCVNKPQITAEFQYIAREFKPS